MSNAAVAPRLDAARPSNWLRAYLIVIAIVEGLEGLGKIPILFAGDAEVPGKGWGGWAVMSELALTLPFALIALFFLIKSDFRRGIAFVAGIGLLKWVSLLPSLANHPAEFPGSGFMGAYQVVQMMIFPLLMLMAIALCRKNERLTLAGYIAGLPTVAQWVGVVIFAIGIAIYGF
jgi:hypothetical protein